MRVACVSCRSLPAWEVDDRPLHAALAARGVDVAVVPWDADVDWASFDAALLRTPWDYQDRWEDFLAWTRRAAEVTRLWHGPDVVAWNVRKTYLLELAARGVPVAPTLVVAPGEAGTVPARVRAAGWARGFLKPVVGAAAHGTLRFDADAAGLEAAAAHVAASDRPMLLQPYLASVETAGEVSVIAVDGRLTHAVRKRPVPGDYRVQDDWGATDAPWPLDEALAAITRRVLAAAGEALGREEPFLYARVDLLDGDDGPVLTELEVIEPSLFFRHGPAAAEALAEAVVGRIGGR